MRKADKVRLPMAKLLARINGKDKETALERRISVGL